MFGQWLTVFESIDLGDANWRSQMMLLGGIALLIWVMFRRNIRARHQSRRDEVLWRNEHAKLQARSDSGAPLADAPVDVARWQAGMFDLQRELKAELETKIAIVQSLVRLADQRIQSLQQLTVSTSGGESTGPNLPAQNSPAKDLRTRSQQIVVLSNQGKTPGEIAQTVGMSLGDVEFLISVAQT